MLLIQRFAAQTVANVLAGTSLNAALDLVWRRNRQLTAAERGAIQDICFGTLRHLGKLSAVLEPFVRLEDSRNRETGGVGLGLTIAKSNIEANGGHLALHNRARSGLCAVVSLPKMPT